MSRVALEVILPPDVRRDVIEFKGARGTYCANCEISYGVLFTDFGQSLMFSLLSGGCRDVLSQYIPRDVLGQYITPSTWAEK